MKFRRFLFALALALTVVACGQDTLSESQSETAGFCMTYMLLSDDVALAGLGSQISEHLEGRGLDEEQLQAGALRAAENVDRDGGVAKPTALQIAQCNDVLGR